MSNIDELKEHVVRLNQLLEDPHPGLFTWQEAVHKRIGKIAEFNED